MSTEYPVLRIYLRTQREPRNTRNTRKKGTYFLPLSCPSCISWFPKSVLKQFPSDGYRVVSTRVPNTDYAPTLPMLTAANASGRNAQSLCRQDLPPPAGDLHQRRKNARRCISRRKENVQCTMFNAHAPRFLNDPERFLNVSEQS